MMRIMLDFSCVENQRNKFVWFAVDTFTFSTIKCLKDSLCNKFNLHDVELYVKKALLREEDTIHLLRDEDVVRVVQRAEETSTQIDFPIACSKKSSKKRKVGHDLDCTNEEKLENINFDRIMVCEDNHAEIEKIRKKRKKHKKANSDIEMQLSLDNEQECSLETVKMNSPLKHSGNSQMECRKSPKSSKIKMGTSIIDVSSDKSFQETFECSERQDLAVNASTDLKDESKPRKRKRIRRRKRKVTPLVGYEYLDKSFNKEVNNEMMESTPKLAFPSGTSNNFKRSDEIGNTHIKFPESSDDSDSSDENIDASVVEIDVFPKTANTNTSIPISQASQELSGKTKITKEDNSEKWSSDGFQSSAILLNELPKSCPQTLASFNSKECEKNVNGEEKQSVKTNRYKPLHILPTVGARVAFKMLELDEIYSPIISDYKEGVVKSADPNGKVEIEFFREEVKTARQGKFEVMYEDDSEPESEVVKTVFVNWSEVIEPQTIIA